MIYEYELYTIAVMLFTSYVSACATWFFDFCIGEPHSGEIIKGRIFSFYGKYILDKYFEVEKDNKLRQSTRLNWWKALGVCPICFNVYLTGLVGMCLHAYFGVNFSFILAEMVLSARFLRKFMEI